MNRCEIIKELRKLYQFKKSYRYRDKMTLNKTGYTDSREIDKRIEELEKKIKSSGRDLWVTYKIYDDWRMKND